MSGWRLPRVFAGAVAVVTLLVVATPPTGATADPVGWDAVASPGEGASAVYFVVAGSEQDTLIGVTTDIARARMHRTELVAGLERMRPVDRVPIDAGEELRFAPGGAHVMLSGLTRPLAVGDTFELRLQFERAGERVITATVVDYGDIESRRVAAAPSSTQDDGGGLDQRDIQLIALFVILLFILGGGALTWRLQMRGEDPT